MTAGDRDGIDGFLAQFVGDLPELLNLEPAQVVRGTDRVEKRRLTKYGHSDVPILHVGTHGPTRDGLRDISATKTRRRMPSRQAET